MDAWTCNTIPIYKFQPPIRDLLTYYEIFEQNIRRLLTPNKKTFVLEGT